MTKNTELSSTCRKTPSQATVPHTNLYQSNTSLFLQWIWLPSILSQQFNLWKQADPFTAVTTVSRHSQKQRATRFTLRSILESRVEQLCCLTARSVPWSSSPRLNSKIIWIFIMATARTSALFVKKNSALLNICKIMSGFTLMQLHVSDVKKATIDFKCQRI